MLFSLYNYIPVFFPDRPEFQFIRQTLQVPINQHMQCSSAGTGCSPTLGAPAEVIFLDLPALFEVRAASEHANIRIYKLCT